MNRLLIAIGLAASSSSLLLIDSTLKGSFILILAATVVVLLRRDSAATRHLVWFVAVLATLVVPVFSASLPHWRVLPSWAVLTAEDTITQTSFQEDDQAGIVSSVDDPPEYAAFPNTDATQTENHNPTAAFGPESPRIDWSDSSEPNGALITTGNPVEESAASSSWVSLRAWPVVWFVGVGALLMRLTASRFLLWSCERRGSLIAMSYGCSMHAVDDNDGNTTDQLSLIPVYEEAVQQLQIQQHVMLLIHAERSIPLVWGMCRHRLLLPATARDWTRDQQKSVLLHELAHIKRRDTQTQLLSQIACAVYWFNPLIWFAAWRLHVERERACDDLVLSNGVSASTYAEHLLNVATRLNSAPWNQACGLAMARRSSLEGRLKAVLSESRNRRTLTSLIVMASLVLGGAVTVPLAMLRAADYGPQTENRSEANDEGQSEKSDRATNDLEINKETPLPKNEKAKLLLKRWQAIEERKDHLKSATISRMRRAINSWVNQPPTKPEAEAVLALRDWELDRDEHPVGEIVAWLDRIASIQPGPIQFAINGERRLGRRLTDRELELLKFGPPAENGLRAAWGRSPIKELYRVGEVIETSLLIQNTTQEVMEFECAYSLSSTVGWNATDEDGQKVDVKEVWLTGGVPLVRFHIKPEQVAEIKGYGGLTIGETDSQPLLQLKARAGQRVTVHWQVRAPVEMVTAPVSFNIAKEDTTSSTTADEDDEPPKAVKLPTETETKLRWGEPVKGLRAALSRLPSLGKAKPGYMDFDLVVQNVSQRPIHFMGNAAAPDVRTVRIRQDGSTLQGLRSGKSSGVDVRLEPGEALILPVFLAEESEPFANGRAMADEPEFTFYGVIEVAEAPEGAWSGKLLTPDTSGAVLSGKQQAASGRNTLGQTIPAAVERKLQWGKAVDGLRAAVMIRDVSDTEQDVTMVVQNVSESDIHIDDTNEENEHTFFEKLDGELQAAFSSKTNRFGNVVLRPKEVAILSVFPPSSDTVRPTGDLMAEILIKTNNMTSYGEVQFLKAPSGTWTGKLRTGETTGIQAAPPSLQLGERIDPATEQRLQWGQSSAGLRAALTSRDRSPDLYLVVQNIQDTPVLVSDKFAAQGQRMLTVFQDDLAQSQTRIDQPTLANVLLQPREVVYLNMAPKVGPNTSGQSKGQLLARALLNKPDMMLIGEMTIATARAGAWTGKLVTGKTGADSAEPGPTLNSESSKSLFQQWMSNKRLNGTIPGGQLRSLVKATTNFVELNPEDQRAPKLAELLKRMDVDRDWAQKEAVELLNDVTTVYDNLPKWATEVSRFSISEVIKTGKPLPENLDNAPWGETQDSGLRTAWLLDPQAGEYRLNTPLKSRILYHNNGTETVFFRVVSWNQSGSHQAQDANGDKIETLSTSWTTIGQVTAVRLAPGEFTEVIGAGIGVGANVNNEDWRNTRVGTWIHAKEDDVVTFTPDAVTISGSDGRQREVEDSVWWLTFITERLQRETPLPAERDERRRILDRALRDLFGSSPTAQEIQAFLADDSPDALSSLAKQLSLRAGTKSVFGQLQSGPTTFRVLPVDPEAKDKPYLAVGPGRYQFDNGATLVIVGRGHVMDSKLELNSGEAYPVNLPDGRGKWAIAWKQDMTTFWIAEQGVLRRVDFANPKQVQETRFTEPTDAQLPKHFLNALRPTFADKKPSAPAAAPATRDKTDDAPANSKEPKDAPRESGR